VDPRLLARIAETSPGKEASRQQGRAEPTRLECAEHAYGDFSRRQEEKLPCWTLIKRSEERHSTRLFLPQPVAAGVWWNEALAFGPVCAIELLTSSRGIWSSRHPGASRDRLVARPESTRARRRAAQIFPPLPASFTAFSAGELGAQVYGAMGNRSRGHGGTCSCSPAQLGNFSARQWQYCLACTRDLGPADAPQCRDVPANVCCWP